MLDDKKNVYPVQRSLIYGLLLYTLSTVGPVLIRVTPYPGFPKPHPTNKQHIYGVQHTDLLDFREFDTENRREGLDWRYIELMQHAASDLVPELTSDDVAADLILTPNKNYGVFALFSNDTSENVHCALCLDTEQALRTVASELIEDMLELRRTFFVKLYFDKTPLTFAKLDVQVIPSIYYFSPPNIYQVMDNRRHPINSATAITQWIDEATLSKDQLKTQEFRRKLYDGVILIVTAWVMWSTFGNYVVNFVMHPSFCTFALTGIVSVLTCGTVYNFTKNPPLFGVDENQSMVFIHPSNGQYQLESVLVSALYMITCSSFIALIEARAQALEETPGKTDCSWSFFILSLCFACIIKLFTTKLHGRTSQ